MERINVLDHGFVELMDVMGNDQAIVDAARVSIAGENVKATTKNEGLIRYLMSHRHNTPFEMVEFKFRTKMPIFVARQWVRHRTANINEMSARYSELPHEFYEPSPENVNAQASKNKQGRSDEVVESAPNISAHMREAARLQFDYYQYYLDKGVARELARINLPLSTYTQWIWKIDLHNLFHFLSLRLDAHAQYEIRVFAEAIAEFVKLVVPIAWEAFEDFNLNAMHLSGPEVEAFRGMLGPLDLKQKIYPVSLKTKRESKDFLAKAKVLMGD